MNMFACEDQSVRANVLRSLQMASRDKTLKILDVGGGKNSWLGDLVTDVIDIKPIDVGPTIKVHIGDVQSPDTWQFQEKEFDFISCTHTLEDIRDPQTVVGLISKYGKSGFIAVPNRHTEVSLIEGFGWLGNYHHRWIFNCSDEHGFQATAKWHYMNLLSQSKVLRSAALALAAPFPRYREAVRNIFPKVVFKGFDRALVADYTRTSFPELSIIWENELKLSLHNQDWAGLNPHDSARIMSEFLSRPFQSEVRSLSDALFAIESLGSAS